MLNILAVMMVCCLFCRQAIAQNVDWEKVYDNIFITSVETTPWGIIAGEYDTRAWLNPFNGVYSSSDLGVTWKQLGLQGRGVVGIRYFEGKVYAVTYYWKDGSVGLFVSENKGETWSHLGNNFSTSSVDRDKNTVYVGGYSHGLWISKDEGITWEQKIGTGWTGPKITSIRSSEEITIVSTQNTSYKSTDHGETWVEIPDFINKSIKYINIDGNIILAGSSGNTGGMYRSLDLANTWEKLYSFGDYASGDITKIRGIYYTGRVDESGNNSSIYYSGDLGVTWTDTLLSIPALYTWDISSTGLFSQPSYLFVVQNSFGIYRYRLNSGEIYSDPFLNTPWNNSYEYEFVDKIYSFFDHTYPLLGYSYYQEPFDDQKTTLNFLGDWGFIPDLYYSAHDGYDYTLPYGTEILAPASGFASYYYCKDCGNAIKIDHLNGYQTSYFHFQKEGLITQTHEPVWVEEGQMIGKVGMTGNTTGPHLHFAVVKDTDGDGLFLDEVPNGRVDPYSWKNRFYTDPWASFSWTDIFGTHRGSKSYYLWKTPYPSTSGYVNDQSKEINLDNITLEMRPQQSQEGITINLEPNSLPKTPEVQKNLGYVANTSLIIKAFDHFGEVMNAPNIAANLKINFYDVDLLNVIPNTLKLYRWDESQRLWAPVPTILNLVEHYLISEIDHFSYFAVFGEKLHSNVPRTEIEITGELENGWYKTYPTVNLTSTDRTFYSIGDTDIWNEYREPFQIQNEGLSQVYYRSLDAYGNIEPTQRYLVKVDTKNTWKKTIKITNSTFNTL